MHRGYVGVFHNCCFWVWSPAGRQAIDGVLWLISALGLGWLPIPRFWSVHWGSQPLIRLRTTRGFRCRHPAGVLGVGPRPLIGVHAHWGTLGLCTQAAGPLIRVHAYPGFQLWAPSLLMWVRATRLQVSAGVAYPAFTVQGLRGKGRQRPQLLWRVLN